jgi:aldose 1-epimerase
MKMKTFDTLDNGDLVLSAILNNGPYEVEILSLGATIHALRVPDKNGKIEDVVLGYDGANDYLSNTTYYGMTVGRFANRIKGGAFEIDGNKYQLDQNDNKVNTLHSGSASLAWKNWDMELIENDGNPSVLLSVASEDGEGGFPGNCEVTVQFTLTIDGKLVIDYTAKSDKKSIMGLTNHSYFNITGNPGKKILDNEVWLDCDGVLAVDDLLIPTGEILDVKNTPFDFNEFHKIGERIDNTPSGYDHCFCFKEADGSFKKRGEIRDYESGRVMSIYTDMPGVQMYTANFFDEGSCGKEGKQYTKNGGVCFETQMYPDAPNNSNFPSCIIEANKEYKYKTVYKFSTHK